MARPTRLLVLLVLALAGGGVAVAPAAAAPRLETLTVRSRVVDPARAAFNLPPGVPARPPALRVNVLLPDGYDARPAPGRRPRRWPLLVLLHGHGDAYDSWMAPGQGDLLRTAAGLPAIVVMPEGARGWYADWAQDGADGRAWERHHLDEVLPLVQRRYRISPRRGDHAIAGLSMGGLGALHYAAQRPGFFGAAASFSGAISIRRPEWPTLFDTQGERHADVYGDPVADAFRWSGHDPLDELPNLAHTRLFVRVGDGVPSPARPAELQNTFGQLAEVELREHAQDVVRAARAAGIDVTYEPRQGIHDWPYWRDALRSAVRWGLFRDADEAPTRTVVRTVSRTGRAWDVRFTFAAPPREVVTFARDGGTLRISGGGPVHLAFAGGARRDVVAPVTLTVPARRAAPR